MVFSHEQLQAAKYIKQYIHSYDIILFLIVVPIFSIYIHSYLYQRIR